MLRFVIRGPLPLLDGKRAYQGREQLSERDRRILERASIHGIQISHEAAGGTVFYCAGIKMPRLAVLRLIQLRYLVPGGDGLLPDTPQTLLTNLSGININNIGTNNTTSATNETPASL
jgi:hypothetical protein